MIFHFPFFIPVCVSSRYLALLSKGFLPNVFLFNPPFWIMKTRIFFPLFLALCFICTSVFGQVGSTKASTSSKADPRVKKLLTELGYKFDVDDDGDFRMTFKVGEDGRTQLLWVKSGTSEFGSLEIREVFSFSYRDATEPSRSLCMKLLRDNYKKKLGAWEMGYSESSELYTAIYNAKIAADADSSTLKDAIQMVSEAADEMEAQISDEDKW